MISKLEETLPHSSPGKKRGGGKISAKRSLGYQLFLFQTSLSYVSNLGNEFTGTKERVSSKASKPEMLTILSYSPTLRFEDRISTIFFSAP